MISYKGMTKAELRKSISHKVRNVKQFKSELKEAQSDLKRARAALRKARK